MAYNQLYINTNQNINMTYLIQKNRNEPLFNDGFYQLFPSLQGSSLFSSLFDKGLSDFSLRFDLKETEDGNYKVELPLPGFKRNEVEIEIEGNTLTIVAKNAKREISKSLDVLETIDTDKIEAKLEDGILTIILVRSELGKPRKIEIK